MNFGDAWAKWLGECNKETSMEILDYFYDQVRYTIALPLLDPLSNNNRAETSLTLQTITKMRSLRFVSANG
jgi:hypothetical protein